MQRSKKDALIRLFSALIPAFIFTNTLGIFITLLFPSAKTEGLSYVLTFAFLFYSALVMWIFHTPYIKTIAIVLGLGITLTGGGSYLIYQD
ncbi:hypothetical protein [Thalassotalea marina]|uniref:DUF3649 domain-containing protein n=1 Tax=Thalassotalea marina TaxID=1673741 RepID=A0A919EIS7_9GAMM|nr:hypothetical protein [Thalassotalea marina]GHF84143.1 hypothetical protein GCM10017161_09410 [Thalassotalea marina]